jgi:ADP-ribose pyrophosphatase YjhB (NUDIX family)
LTILSALSLIVNATIISCMIAKNEKAKPSPRYDARSHVPFAVTVDIVVFTLRAGNFEVLLIRRGSEPFKGKWALPGGFVHPDESLDEAAARELAEETGIEAAPPCLQQIRAYGDPERDPRMRVVTVCYAAIVPNLPSPRGGSDAAEAALHPVSRVESGERELAFDHAAILGDAVKWVRTRLENTNVATAFCRPRFTLTELRQVYEAVWGVPLEPANFSRKVRAIKGFVKPIRGQPVSGDGAGRPARLYTSAGDTRLYPPFRTKN